VRYTLPDEDRPFDLCRECFRLGTDYAATHEFSESQNVVIKGKTVGEETKLCSRNEDAAACGGPETNVR
jgi:hypothetical protein